LKITPGIQGQFRFNVTANLTSKKFELKLVIDEFVYNGSKGSAAVGMPKYAVKVDAIRSGFKSIGCRCLDLMEGGQN
jgi:hypothetical protein